MQRVGRADVYGVDRWVVQDAPVVAGRLRDAQLLAQLPRPLIRVVRQSRHFHVAQPPNGFDVYAPHESGAEYRRFQSLHVASCCSTVTARFLTLPQSW